MPINNRIAELSEEAAVWRRDFHSNPELLFDLPRTSTLVAERLRAFGVDRVETRIGRVGVVGVIEGSRGAGPTIGLRADMDALPILEATGKTYASQSPGRMHACGHDGHTAMLLGQPVTWPRPATSLAAQSSSSSRPRKVATAPRRWSRRA